MKYAIFLRGINVGGNKKVPMAELKKMLGKEGYGNVATLLNSGNVILETEKKPAILKKTFEEAFGKKFGFTSSAIVRSFAELEKLAKANPFKGINVTKDTRLYLTFLSEKPKSTLKIPYASPDKSFKILKVTDDAIISVLTVMKNVGTTEAMGILEKEFGRNITTRNWNTVQKLLKLA